MIPWKIGKANYFLEMQEKELLAEAPGLFERTVELFFSDGWHLDKDKEEGKVYSKKHNNRTIFKLQVITLPVSKCPRSLGGRIKGKNGLKK